MDLISAICVTHPSRFGLLQRSLVSFLGQSYPRREMILVTNEAGYADAIRAFLDDPRLKELFGAGYPSDVLIRVVPMAFRQPLEAFYHAAIWAEGAWLVCWDDDDLSHPDRLGLQKERTKLWRATVFSEALYYFYDSDELFVTNFSQPAGRASERCAASSLMFHRGSFGITDASARDAWAPHVLDRIAARGCHDCISGEPEMFLVGSNGDNYRTAAVHRRLGSGLPATWMRSQLLERAELIDRWLDAYAFPRDTVDVCGKDAQAFASAERQVWPSWFQSVLPPQDWRQGIPNRALLERTNEERAQRRHK